MVEQGSPRSFGRLLGILAIFQGVAAIVVVALLIGHSRRVEARRQALDGLVTVRSIDDGYHQAEAGLRGYALTGNERYLTAYTEGLARGDRALADLRTRAREWPRHLPEVEALTRSVEQKRAWMSETLAHRRASTLEVERFREAAGLLLMERISASLAGIEASERMEIQALDRTASWHLGLGLWVLCAATLAVILLLVTDIRDRRRNEATLRRSRQILQDLSEGTAGAVGPAFFASLAVHAARALGTRWSAVLQFEAPGRVGILALADGGELREMESFDAKDCVCLEEAAEGVCFVPDGAERTHATHPLVAHLGARSFLGVPMVDDSHFKGALLVLDDKPMAGTDLAVPALRAFAERTVAEFERLRTEAALHQAQKMEALGALVGGVVHDFNNLLAAIHSASELADLRLPPVHPARRPLEVIQKSVSRGRELNQQILGFTRISEQKQISFNLAAVVREVCDLLATTIPSTIAIRAVVTESAGMWGDPGRLFQVVLNLALNACHAMKETGGVLELSLQAPPLDVEATGPCLKPRPDRRAILTVSDTGCGMTPEAAAHMSDPFFTTKTKGEGTGLGLFVVQGIVRQHQGSIRVQSRLGVGTTFEVTLPLTRAPLADQVPSGAEALNGDEAILLVEPDDLLLALAKQGLRELGYRVTGRSSAAEALDILLPDSQAYDVLVAAHHPPTLDGAALLRQARVLRPGLSGVLILDPLGSFGSSFDDLEGSDEIITKFSAPKDLARAIRRAVEFRPVPGIQVAKAERIPSVLIVEDSPTARRFMASALTKAGYAVQEAEDGQAAWDLVMARGRTDPFDVLVIDLTMPRMDGFELMDRLKAWDPRAPLMVVTSRNDGEAFRRAMGLGAADFLLKPVDPGQLIECVDRLWSTRFPDAS